MQQLGCCSIVEGIVWQEGDVKWSDSWLLMPKSIVTVMLCNISLHYRVLCCSEVKSSVPDESYMLGDWLSGWVIDWVCNFSPWATSATDCATEMKFGTRVA